MNKHDAISAMNKLGKKHLPFWFMVNYDMSQTVILTAQEALDQGVLFSFPNYSNCTPPSIIDEKPELSFYKKVVPLAVYQRAFDFVKQQLQLGNSYLVNLTFPSEVEINRSLAEIFDLANAKYKLLYRNQFVVFSPETFVRIQQGTISTYPMKGTMDANLPNALNVLMDNEKEYAEHATIVDLLRNDLSLFASNVQVSRFRYADTIISNQKTLLQMSSEITGQLSGDYCSHLGDILFGMLPAGSVTGAPKAKTLEIIGEAENYNRGFYTGISGWFDGYNLDSCVLIRFMENNNGKLTYKSGGGITSQSDLLQEYQELIDKIYVPIA